MGKIKVVWICHFSNDYIQQKLKPRKRINSFAPWITFGIEEAKKRDDIELHVISPHCWIKNIIEFEDSGIYYHFFNPGIPYYGRHWPKFFRLDIITNYYQNRKKILKFINKINPSIVNIYGLENAYYSISFFDIRKKKIPILITIQGFNHLQIPEGKLDINFKSRLKTEQEILKKACHFGIMTKHFEGVISNYNKKAKFYLHELFINDKQKRLKHTSEIDKINGYDIVFFARVTKFKGIEDLIKVFCDLKKEIPRLKMGVIGICAENYLSYLKSLIKHDCIGSVKFHGFLAQEIIYSVLHKSKVVVLPTYNDNMPGTIIESMFNKIPVLAYKTGGIAELNNQGQIIELSEQGDTEDLKKKLKYLIENKHYRKKLADNAYLYAKKRWNNANSMEELINAYKKVIEYTKY